MPDEVTRFGATLFARLVGKQGSASGFRVSVIVKAQHFGDGTALFLAQIMSCTPEDDSHQLAASSTDVVSIAVVVQPTPCDGFDIGENIIIRCLGESGGLLDFGDHFADGIFWHTQTELSGTTEVGNSLQVINPHR